MHTDFAEENVIGHDQEMSNIFARQSDQDEEGAEDGDDDTNLVTCCWRMELTGLRKQGQCPWSC